MQRRDNDFETFHKRVKIILSFFYLDLIVTILALITSLINSEYSRPFSAILISIGILCLCFTIFLAKKNRELIYLAETLFHKSAYRAKAEKLSQFELLMKDNRFTYHFQPIIHAKTGEIFAYEALMRTNPDTIGLNAIEILHLADKENRLYEIEKYTFENVLCFIKEHHELFGSKKIFINSIAGHQLTNDDFNQLYQNYSSQFANVVIEITESAMLTEDGLQLIKSRLLQTNLQLALDDYGTEYFNEANLLKSNPSYVKIDASILRNLQSDIKKQHLVRNLIHFASKNNIKIIAERIETYEEFEYVINLNVDYIQGFYTAYPSPEMLQRLPEQILTQLKEINSRSFGKSSVSRIYETRGEKLLSPVTLTLDLYSDILVLEKELTLQGNQGMVANMNIIIPDNRSCTLILDQVNLRSNDRPTIILGDCCSVTIRLIGDNYISYNGIRVPETSSLEVCGDGNLIIQAERTNKVGIGGTPLQSYGNITLASTGIIKVISSGNMSVGIGGGQNPNQSLIHLISGNIYVESSGFSTVGVGCIDGNARIIIEECKLKLITEGTKAVGIGSLRGMIDLVSSGNLVIKCNGRYISAIGGMEECEGKIIIQNGVINIRFSGYCSSGIGAIAGRVHVEIHKGDITISGEGANIVGIGDQNGFGDILIKNGIIYIDVFAPNALPIGNISRSVVIDGGNIQCDFPEDINLTNSFGTPLVPRIITDTDEFRQVIDTISYSYEYNASYSDRYPYIKVYLPEGISY